MKSLLPFLLCLLVCTGCSVLGTRMNVEPVDDSRWKSIDGWSFQGSPANQSLYMCDSSGFMLLYFGEYPRTLSWGLMLLPLVPGRLPLMVNTTRERYYAVVTLPVDRLTNWHDLLEHLHFFFNGDTSYTAHNLSNFWPASSLTPLPPCGETTGIERSHSLVDIISFRLEFNIHPDSVETITITADKEFNAQTGLSFTSVKLENNDHLYYMPFVFFGS